MRNLRRERRDRVKPEPGQRKWLPAKKVPNFPRGTEAEVFKAFQATAADEVTVPAGSLVTALYRDEQWIYVERADGRKGFIPDRCCSLCMTQTVPERQKMFCRKKQQVAKKPDRNPVRRAETFDYGQCTRRYIKRSESRIRRPPTCSTLDRKTLKSLEEGTIRISSRIEKFLESLPKDEDGELFVKEPSGEREILYSFQARTEDELSVEKGQLLTILNTTDPNWTWAVDIHGREGFVPANFFSPYDPCEQDDSDLDTMLDFVVVQDFQALSEVDMSVRKGDRLKAPYESVHGWIWAEQTSDRVQGFVPACVTLLATEF
ncbi:hypothetical protein QR680_007513 [Steinernema hermaphroditum]|uniref:SH3 domain-containing protein n=1 Tax=Steinernema hermaphroditum TaxID=289476 RepID=A0AA39IEU0_9BILA|nr:hypothetical protein QR680_007513 [Steinernema hermaphroditum]